MYSVLSGDRILIQQKQTLISRDVYGQVIRITGSIESYRDILSGLLDIFIPSVSNKMNKVKKVLTIFASVFYTVNLYCRYIRHEFRIYAGTQMEVDLPGAMGFIYFDSGCITFLFHKEEMAVRRNEKFEPSPGTMG